MEREATDRAAVRLPSRFSFLSQVPQADLAPRSQGIEVPNRAKPK
jgi:hypothetical protein